VETPDVGLQKILPSAYRGGRGYLDMSGT